MTDELNKLIAEARTRTVTDEEREAQRVSFAYGNLALDQPETSRELVQTMSDNVTLIKSRTQWMKKYYRISHDYDRLKRTAGALAGCVFGLLIVIAALFLKSQ